MPTYDYKCTLCGHVLEEFQSMSAAPLVKCPECEKDGLKRIFSMGAGMIFKGQGFYLTDYKKSSDPAKTAAKKETPAAPAKTESTATKESPKKDS
ncbi:MAG: zinc ribbon domain-containing protein [Bacteroidota bacterium]